MGIYNKYYGLSADPFHITPDPSVLLLTESHRRAIGAIGYGIHDRKGFVVVTGEVGVGKTTALRACLDELPPDKSKVIYIFDPKITSDVLYATILDSLDGDTSEKRSPSPVSRPVDAIHHALLEYFRRDINVILTVDEAQHMPAETLESLRLLSNLETTNQKLLQIILVGQPELDAVLAAHSMRQLDQRFAVRAHMVPLTFGQSLRYIRHRLAMSGWSGQDDLFTLPAACYLAWHAKGIARKLNIHCDNALANGYGMSAKRITLHVARLALVDMPKRRVKVLWKGAGLACLAVAACGAAFAIAPETTRAQWTGIKSSVEAGIGEMARGKPKQAAGEPVQAAPSAIVRTVADPLQPAPPTNTPASPVTEIAAAPVSPVPVPVPTPPEPEAPVVPAPPPALPDPQPDVSTSTAATAAAAPILQQAAAPDPAPPPAQPPSAPVTRTLTARTGDTLIGLCAQAYGRCTRDLLLSLAKANQIAVPDLLISGKILAIPPLRPNATRHASQESESQ